MDDRRRRRNVDALGLPGPGAYDQWALQGCNCPVNMLRCSGIDIPRNDLTIHWFNSLLGNGSAPLVYNPGGPQWVSGCANNLMFSMYCDFLTGLYFGVECTLGTCPGGMGVCCDTVGPPPGLLQTVSITGGSGFNWVLNCVSPQCTSLAANAYSGFAITNP